LGQLSGALRAFRRPSSDGRRNAAERRPADADQPTPTSRRRPTAA